jgi:uncharacterized protein YcfL
MNKYKLILIIIGASFLLGCSSTKNVDSFEGDNHQYLLFTQDKYAAKSITKEDYIIKEWC